MARGFFENSKVSWQRLKNWEGEEKMMQLSAFLTIISLILLIAVPLMVYFPLHIVRYFLARHAWKRKRSDFKPSRVVVALYVWFLLTVPAVAAVQIILSLFPNGRARQSEAKTNLGAVFTSQTAYLGEYSTYASGPDAFGQIGWGPEGSTKYTYFTGQGRIDPIDPERRIRYSPDGEWPFPARPETTNRGFTAVAVGNVDRDDALDVWTLNDAKNLRNVVNDVSIGATFRLEPWNWIEIEMIKAAGLAMILLALLSPAMVVVVPMLYHEVLGERRKWKEWVRRKLVQAPMGADERE